jgi:hypothetical protein
MSLATYFVAFEPAPNGSAKPQATLTLNGNGITRTLPCLLLSEIYTIAWSLVGDPGDSAPGLIKATAVEDRFGVGLDGITKPAASPGQSTGAVSSKLVAPCPVGFDRITGLPIQVTDSVVHDFVLDYILP